MSVSPIWPAGSAVNDEGEITFHGRTAASLLDEFGSPLYVIDTDDVRARATKFVHAASHAFNNTVTHVSFAGKALLSKEICRIVTESGMLIDTCTMGEMRIALAAGVPGRRLVLHGNNKSDAEIELAIEQGFNKIVIDEPDEPARIAAIAKRLGKRARVMLRVTSGIHAGGHEFVSTAHEDQKFGVALLPAGADTAKLGVLDDLTDVTPAGSNARLGENAADAADQAAHAGHAERKLQYDVKYPYDLSHEKVSEGDRRLAEAMTMVADGPALAVLKDIYRRQDVLELVGVHSHIGSNIHDADASPGGQAHDAAAQDLLRHRRIHPAGGRLGRRLFRGLHRWRGFHGSRYGTCPPCRCGHHREPCARHARSGHFVRTGRWTVARPASPCTAWVRLSRCSLPEPRKTRLAIRLRNACTCLSTAV